MKGANKLNGGVRLTLTNFIPFSIYSSLLLSFCFPLSWMSFRRHYFPCPLPNPLQCNLRTCFGEDK